MGDRLDQLKTEVVRATDPEHVTEAMQNIFNELHDERDAMCRRSGANNRWTAKSSVVNGSPETDIYDQAGTLREKLTGFPNAAQPAKAAISSDEFFDATGRPIITRAYRESDSGTGSVLGSETLTVSPEQKIEHNSFKDGTQQINERDSWGDEHSQFNRSGKLIHHSDSHLHPEDFLLGLMPLRRNF